MLPATFAGSGFASVCNDINNLTISIGADYKAKIKDESGLKISCAAMIRRRER